ncbi:Cho2p [Saccharomyces cerevisiae YJM1248]|nr:Cho2p [Saccharomyces cerevisiae YJM627]AJR96973.1 Cho2p [Saccharomyces cerevisiae YJM1248]AJS01445.1 Cho2p [Saccharomyces cerevisiae YJM1439]CAD6469699.1 Y55_G0034810.mRNA.1.CDS.1 [Saccharomyces cerevisiae]
MSSCKTTLSEMVGSVTKDRGTINVKARTRSSNVTFKPPVTHDMVRSLFDPTLKKSLLEKCIALAIISNFFICYWVFQRFGLQFTKYFFLVQYLFWRIAYNLGIGLVLHYQSHYETLTNCAKTHAIFSKIPQNKDANSNFSTNSNSFSEKFWNFISKFCQYEIRSKMPKEYDLFAYPEEINVWLIFRQFVDLILMQDFVTYIIYVYLSIPYSWVQIFNWRSLLGVILILFNIWVKLDAHRVVKDYAWYWGDFFFLEESELIFDGVFNISPHPMYSIGYLGYYGLSLICNDYRVLLVSVFGHYSQFLFLKYVENPHIERTYGDGTDSDSQMNSRIDDLISKENYDYSRPLINMGLSFNNFNKLRFTDYFTIGTVAALMLGTIMNVRFINLNYLFITVFVTKLVSWLFISTILCKQSQSKWFTRLFLENGYTQVYSYEQWQFIYNYYLVLTYTLMIIHTGLQIWSNFSNINNSQLIFGLILVALQTWCDKETRLAISDFGWFYGDFFLSNYISTRKLTSQGIYRYLNHPEAVLGVVGVWGTVLMTNFAVTNVILAVLWTLTNFILVKFIETPHVNKIYGKTKRVSGVGKTLLGLKPLRQVSDIVNRIENIIIKSLVDESKNSNGGAELLPKNYQDNKEWNILIQEAMDSIATRLSPYCELKIENEQIETNFVLPTPVTLNWKMPIELYNGDDWIGLYKVIDTRADREKTRVGSGGHWSATSKDSYMNHGLRHKESVTEIKATEKYVQGKVTFDTSLLYFENGIYEFRYHSGNSHKVLLISTPFEISLPVLNTTTPKLFEKDLTEFLTKVNVLKDGKFRPLGNKFFGMDSLKQLIKNSIGVELSSEYMRRVNGDAHVISHRAWDIKQTLDSLA